MKMPALVFPMWKREEAKLHFVRGRLVLIIFILIFLTGCGNINLIIENQIDSPTGHTSIVTVVSAKEKEVNTLRYGDKWRITEIGSGLHIVRWSYYLTPLYVAQEIIFETNKKLFADTYYILRIKGKEFTLSND